MITYDGNAELRQRYHEMNGMTHAFAYRNGTKSSHPWVLYFGRDTWIGFNEGGFRTLREAKAAAAKHHPELIWLGHDGKET